MPQAIIFDMDGTLVDSVDLHALAWERAFVEFGHQVTFEQARGQIGKGGDQLLPVFLSDAQQADHGEALEAWRGDLFKSAYLPMLRPFSAVPDLMKRIRDAGIRIAIASSAKQKELDVYLEIAGIKDWVDEVVSSEDAEQSKPAPDIFSAALKKLKLAPDAVIAIGDTPYDAQAATKAGIRAVGVLCGGFTEASLREGGCMAVYPGPASLLACFDGSPLAT
jgi:phosphoglycolate phosphatase-like HAD superfamily hydrolase